MKFKLISLSRDVIRVLDSIKITDISFNVFFEIIKFRKSIDDAIDACDSMQKLYLESIGFGKSVNYNYQELKLSDIEKYNQINNKLLSMINDSVDIETPNNLEKSVFLSIISDSDLTTTDILLLYKILCPIDTEIK